MKNKKAYTIYKYNKFNKDYEYIKELYDIKEVQKEFKEIKANSIYHYITNSIDDIKHLLKDEYIIIKENIPI